MSERPDFFTIFLEFSSEIWDQRQAGRQRLFWCEPQNCWNGHTIILPIVVIDWLRSRQAQQSGEVMPKRDEWSSALSVFSVRCGHVSNLSSASSKPSFFFTTSERSFTTRPCERDGASVLDEIWYFCALSRREHLRVLCCCF